MDRLTLSRREALRTLVTGAVGAAASASWVESLSALAHQQAHDHAADAAIALQEWSPRVLSAQQNEAVVVLTELIIPETDTPGAKGARVNRFIDAVLQDARPADRERFLQGLDWMDERSRSRSGKDIAAAAPADVTALLTQLSKEDNQNADDRPGIEFFQALKSMTIDGYYTTEIGLKQELGDDGQLFLLQFPGCNHPEHQA
jgi:hypothetical protein